MWIDRISGSSYLTCDFTNYFIFRLLSGRGHHFENHSDSSVVREDEAIELWRKRKKFEGSFELDSKRVSCARFEWQNLNSSVWTCMSAIYLKGYMYRVSLCVANRPSSNVIAPMLHCLQMVRLSCTLLLPTQYICPITIWQQFGNVACFRATFDTLHVGRARKTPQFSSASNLRMVCRVHNLLCNCLVKLLEGNSISQINPKNVHREKRTTFPFV